MFLPELKSDNVKPLICNKWGGFNRSDNCSENEFADMYNASCRRFPYVSCRPERKTVLKLDNIQALCAPLRSDNAVLDESDFCGVANDRFHYNSTDVGEVSDIFKIPAPFDDVEKYPDIKGSHIGYTLIPYNDVINIFPSFKSYDPRKEEFEDLCFNTTIKSSWGVMLYSNWPESRDRPNYQIIISTNHSSAGRTTFDYIKDYAEENDYYIYKSTDFDAPKVGDRIVLEYDVSKISVSDTSSNNNWNTYDTINPDLKYALSHMRAPGDYVASCFIRELGTYEKNGVEYVYRLGVDLIDVDGNFCTFQSGEDSQSADHALRYICRYKGDFVIKKYVPPIKYACVCKDRIFALDPYGVRISACAYCEQNSWSDYLTGEAGSWFMDVASYGEWTGICNFGGNVYCFKNDVCYVIYGDNATNFTLAKTINCGCIDGKSICVVDNMMFFLSSDGFYACSGSQPVKISECLEQKYTKATGGCKGDLYYVSAKRDDGVWELLVYNTSKSMWHKEDGLVVRDFLNFGNRLYAGCEKNLVLFGDGVLPDEWYVESTEMREAVTFAKSIVSLYFSFRVPPGGEVDLYIKNDGNEYVKCGTLYGKKLSCGQNSITELTETAPEVNKNYAISVVRFPVRFNCVNSYRFKLVFRGDIVFEALERSVVPCGRSTR